MSDNVYRLKLIKLQELRDNILNHYILPYSTNYVIEIQTSHDIRLYVSITCKTFRRTHFPICDHMRLLNPNHDCYLEFTLDQLKQMFSEEDFKKYVKIDNSKSTNTNQ